MRKALPWILGAALVLGAGAVTAVVPDEDSLTDAIVVRGAAGDEITARSLVVTLQDAVFTDRVEVEAADWSAEGNWLVVSLAAEAAQTEQDAVVGLATLTVDGRVFQASERPAVSLLQTRLHVGTPIAGTLAFELPADLRAGRGELRVTRGTSTPQLDDVIAVPLDLGALQRTPRYALESPGWAP